MKFCSFLLLDCTSEWIVYPETKITDVNPIWSGILSLDSCKHWCEVIPICSSLAYDSYTSECAIYDKSSYSGTASTMPRINTTSCDIFCRGN